MQGLRYRVACRAAGVVLLALCACLQAHAQTQVTNIAQVAPPTGVTDPDTGNNTDTALVDVYAVALQKVADPVSGIPVAVGATLQYTVTATISDGATTAEPLVVTDTLGPGLELVTPLPADCSQSGSVLTCTVPAGTTGTYSFQYSATVTSAAGTSVGNSVTGGDSCDAGCSTTHPVQRGVTLTKVWVDGASGDSVALAISGTGITGAVAGSSAAGGATTPATATAPADATVDLAETFTPAGSAGNYTTTLACVRDIGGGAVTVTGSGQSGSFTMPADSDVTCTFTNTRSQTTLQLVKTWQDARPGETATVVADGFTNDASSGFSTADASGGGTTEGIAVTVYAGETGTITESLDNAANYEATLACTGTSGLSGNTLTVAPGDGPIVCTQTNTRRQTTLQLVKTWQGALPGETATVQASGFTNNASSGPSVADAGGGGTTTGTAVVVYAGETGTISETLTNPGDYDATLACTGTTGLAGDTLTVAPDDGPIVCTQTNARRQASLTLGKTWANAAANEQATVTATGSANGPFQHDSTATTPNATGSSGPFTVFAGETITVSETFGTPANAANYASELVCTGAADWDTGDTSFVVDASDSNIACTYTNTRLQAQLRLEKAWGANSRTGDTAHLAASTGLENNTAPLDVVAPTGGVTPFVTVSAGEVANLPAETMGGTALADYSVTLACTGGTLGGTDGTTGNTLEILPDDAGTDIVCTYTNNRVPTTLTLQKVWLNAIPNDSVTLLATGLPEFVSTASGGAEQTDTSGEMDIYAGQVINLTESFSGPPDVYDTTLACEGASVVVSGDGRTGTITVGADGAPVICTFTNDRQSAQLVVQKVWAGGGPASTVTIPPSSGFTNNTPQLVSTSPTTGQTAPVTVFVMENGTLPAESFTSGNASDYDSTVTCDGTDTDPSDGLFIPIADADSTITCTYSNTFVKRAQLDVDKSVAGVNGVPGGSVTEAGDVISYQITIDNSGNVPLTGVTVDDPLVGDLVCTPAPPVDLAIGGSISCTASYTVTQADIDRIAGGNGASGSITNVATAGGTDPDDVPVDGQDDAVTPLPANDFEFAFVKDAQLVDSNGSGSGSAGETINYTFTFTNNGNTSAIIDSLDDPLLPDLSCTPLPTPPVAPGDTITFGPAAPAQVVCSGLSYQITQQDIDDRGTNASNEIQNTATAGGSSQNGGSESRSDSDNVPLDPPNPQIQLEKSASPGNVDNAGDVVTYTFTVTNPGNVTVTGITVTDAMAGLGPITCTPAAPFDLAPGATAQCQAQYTVTQADIDSGAAIVNTASADGEYNGDPVTDEDDAAVDVDGGDAQPELLKFATPTAVTAAGQQVTYTFRVSNPSQRTLSNLQITDDTLLDGVACDTIPSLAPDSSADFTCTGNVYTVTQADIDQGGVPTANSGELVNTVTGQAEYLDDGNTVVATDTASATVSLPNRLPSIFLTKGSDVASVSAAGNLVTYTFNVLNNGNVTLTDLQISDTLLPGLACTPIASLAPGANADFTCTAGNVYTVTQADIDNAPNNGQIINVATVQADTPVPAVPTVQDDDEHRVDLPVRRTDMTLVKSADVASISAPGTVNYRFEVSNTGNVSITDLELEDATLGLSCPTVPELLPGQTLSFGAAPADVVCSGTSRTVDQADIDTLTSLDNQATASGQTVAFGAISRQDALSLPIVKNPGLALDKSADVASVQQPGDPIVYTIAGSNTGNVTLANVVVADPMLDGVLSCTPASPIAALAPGEDFNCTGTYPASASDFDTNGGGDGFINNTVTVSWDGGSATDSAQVQLPAVVRVLELTKTADTPTIAGGLDPAVTDAGDTIAYQFAVTNTGTQTLTGLLIVDNTLTGPITCDPTVIGVGETVTCTGEYTILQADMDAGSVANTANARGTAPSGDAITSGPSTATVVLAAQPAITLDKEAGAPTTAGGALPGATDAGDTIAYTFEVTNTGNVTLRDVTVTDPLPGLGGISCPTGQVAPGASVTCTGATHTITQAEMDAGEVTNTATAAGLVPAGGTVEGDDSTTTPLAATPAITLAKSANPTTYTTLDQTIAYSYLVTNTGSVTVSTLQVSDDLIATVSCPATTLAPGESTTCTGSYDITQADLDTGSVTNNAEATATPSQGTLAPATDSATITADQTPELTLVKTATPTTVSSVGEVVTYSFEVSNGGNVTVDALAITETAFSGTGTPPAISCPVTELAPGANTTCTGTYTVTQADLDAGQVTNTATANGTDPGGAAVVSDPDDATVTVDENAGLTLVKTATPTTVSAVGEVVTYSFEVSNGGNVTIDALAITETAFSGTGTPPAISCPVTELAPGVNTTCTGTYTVTQADLDAGSITNTATANGTDPGGTAVVSDPDDATVTVDENAELTLVKTATPTTVSTVGEVVTYSFEVSNGGNVTVDALAITETAFSGTGTPPAISCPVTELAPGVNTTCTGTYTVTQADLDAGQVTNTATANGTDPGGAAVVSDPDDAMVTASQAPGLTLDKSTTATTYDSVGDLLPYGYQVTNSGNVTLTTAITVDDDRIVAPNSVNCPALPAGGLAPGDAITCTATHIVTQADLDAGSVVNVATATDGTTVSNQDSVTVAATQTPAIVLDKTATVADTNGDGVLGDAGDTITYAFSVENTGNVVLAPVTVTDPLLPGLSCTIATLSPGDTDSCAATGNTYVITTADEANGSVDNTATATGDAPGSAPDATAQDTASTPTQLTPAATTVAKSADPDPGTEVAPGDTITYTVTVTVADASLHEPVTLTDTLGDGLSFVAVTSAGAFTCNAADPLVCTLPAGTAPGAYPVVYTATVDDDATDSVGNSVVASKPAGTDPDPVCTTCDTNHPVVPSTSIVSKSSTPASNVPVNPGTTITFTLMTVVSGSITTEPITLVDTMDPGLTFVAVTDPGAYSCSGALTCVLPADTLPGSYDVVYTATVDAEASGVLNNTVVPSNPPGGDTEPACDGCNTVHPVSRPSIELEKEVTGNDDADGNGEVSVGDTLTYTVTATNTGNVPLANVTIDDPLVDPDSITCALVAPGAQCQLVGTYVVVQADADAGQVLNEATVTTEAPPDVPPLPPEACPAGSTDEACTTDNVTPVIQRPAIATTKVAVLSVDNATPGKGNIGDVITYSVDATNTGNITLTGVTVNDTFQGGTPVTLACAPTTLGPGQVATCDSYDHTITEAEARSDDGLLVNTVLAQGDAGVVSGTIQVTANALAQVEVQNEPAQLYLVKTVAVREVNVGDMVRYSLTLENTGDIDLVDGYIIDTPALGFTYVEGSLAGDDDDHSVVASGSSPLRISDIDIAAGHTATMSYLMRVGAGVRPGVQINRAIAYDPAYDGPASNEATAEVVLGSDPLLDESLIGGTVFGDRDGDGWQDSAALTGVRVQGGFAPGAYVAGSTTVDRGEGPQPEPDASSPLLHGIALGRVEGRQSQADPSSAHEVVVRQRLRELAFTDDFVLTSGQGATVRMAADGSTTVETTGDAAKGLTAAVPTVQRRVAQAGDGYQVDYVVRNEGIDERGIPGVRIASVEGLLIETDQYGRYHLVGIDAGKSARGRNFILKLDTATLPKGAELTTENPKLRRITGGVPTRFDFGVRLPEQLIQGHRTVEMTLGEVVFAPGSAQVQARYLPVIDSMAEQVRRNGAGEVVVSADGETEALALARASAVRGLLDERLDESLRQRVALSVRADPDDPATLVAGIGEGGPVLGTLLFDTDQATIQPRFDAVLDQVAKMLAEGGATSVSIIGHADRRASREYNAALGLRRARAVYEALAQRLPPDVRARLTVEVDPDPAAPLDAVPRQEGTP